MEGLGARLGRSSTRYGPTPVFSGQVRKWKKKWVPFSSLPFSINDNGNGNGNTPHLLLYKWIPFSSDALTTAAVEPEEPPRKRFRYIPSIEPMQVHSIEERKQKAVVKSDDENEPSDADPSPRLTQIVGSDAKAYVKDAAMEEAQPLDNAGAAADVTETNLDLNLGLKAHNEDGESEPKLVIEGKDYSRLERERTPAKMQKMELATNERLHPRP